MAKKRSTVGRDDPLAAYRRVRKPMPPPTRTDEDRRRESLDELERREAREAADEAAARVRAGSGGGEIDADDIGSDAPGDGAPGSHDAGPA